MKMFKNLVHYCLLTVIVLYLISGFGITYYRIIQPLSLGFLDKASAFKLHVFLAIPLIVLLLLHIFLTMKRYFKKS